MFKPHIKFEMSTITCNEEMTLDHGYYPCRVPARVKTTPIAEYNVAVADSSSQADTRSVCITVQHGSAYTVVRATSREGQNWGYQNSETPEPIVTKFGMGHYVGDMTQ